MNKSKDKLSSSINERFNLTRQERFIYSLTNLPNTILAGIFELTYVNFFWDDLKLQQFYFSIGLIIYAIVNSFNDFYLGRISDLTNSEKWGSRRLIYIKFGGLLWAFVTFAMFFPWSYTNQIIIFIHFVISICAFDMLLSLVWLVWLALLPELTENSGERNNIALYINIIGVIGAFPVLLAFYIYEISLLYFQIFAGTCALICGTCYFIVGSKLKERPELYIQQDIIPLIRAIKEVLKSKSFRAITIFRVFNHINLSLVLGFIFAYFYVTGVDLLTASLLVYFNYTFIMIIGYAIYKKLSVKHEIRTLIIRGRILQITINVIAFLVLLIPGLTLLIWVFFSLGMICQGYMLFDYPLLMLTTDDDEITYGSRREGMIMGANAFFIKIGQSIGPIIGTFVLLSFGFVRDAPTQTNQALIGIKFLFFIVPSIMSFLGLLGIIFFPLHGENLENLQRKLLEIHGEKAESYRSR
jgi:GPH family glycoside/pentoside/hexuronide:cation symporter